MADLAAHAQQLTKTDVLYSLDKYLLSNPSSPSRRKMSIQMFGKHHYQSSSRNNNKINYNNKMNSSNPKEELWRRRPWNSSRRWSRMHHPRP